MRYNPGMPRPRVVPSLIRLFYKHFYNRLAFTYDLISMVVSRGEWRAWTRAAIPFVRPPNVLEIAFGTGNLLLDLVKAGYAPLGVDLSPYMIQISQLKFQARGLSIPIVRARVQQLPFPSAHFSSVVMTFPPGFITNEHAIREIRRVLTDDGCLIWVDAPHLYPRDAWSRFLNWAYQLTGGAPPPGTNRIPDRTANASRAALSSKSINPRHPPSAASARWTAGHGYRIDNWLPHDGWSWRVEKVERQAGYVHVMIGFKIEEFPQTFT